MGVCFDCAMTIDGQAGLRACMTPVRDGMSVETGPAESS
jgi:sarcosine oxidase subunit alpha